MILRHSIFRRPSGALHSTNELLRDLSRWGTTIAPRDIPVDIFEAAKTQVLSTLGAVHAGYRSDLGAPIARAFPGVSGDGDQTARAIPSSVRTTSAHAAFLMSSWAMVLDIDDLMLGGHTGHSTVLVPLAYIEKTGRSGKDLLTAQIIANEIASRVNMSVALGPIRGQMATHLHLVGAVVARAKLEGLDTNHLAEAIAFALSYPPKALHPGFIGSDAKTFCAAWPIQIGLSSVDAIIAGMRGNLAILEGDHGFIRSFTRAPALNFFGTLGQRWHTVTNSIKQYPTSAYLNGVLDATLSLVRQYDIDYETVDRIDVHASIFTMGMEIHSVPYLKGVDSHISTLSFSTPYAVACALLYRSLLPDHFSKAYIQNECIWRMASKVHLHHDMQFTLAAVLADIPIGAAFKCVGRIPALRFLLQLIMSPTFRGLVLKDLLGFCRLAWAVLGLVGRPLSEDMASCKKSLGARVTIRTQDGRVFDECVMIPKGFAGSGDWRSLRRLAREKYIDNAAPNIGSDNALKAADIIENLEIADAPEVKRLIDLNCIPQKP
jgi:2-methylcitrate dehydratase PrpD